MNTSMKNHIHALFSPRGVHPATCVVGLAQPTWTVGETVLNEYDLVSGVNIPLGTHMGPDDMLWCTAGRRCS